MNYRRVKNNIIISVKKWDDKITLTDKVTGKIIKVVKFTDHIQAVLLAKQL